MKRAWWGSRQLRQVHQMVKIAVVIRDEKGYCMLKCDADIKCRLLPSEGLPMGSASFPFFE